MKIISISNQLNFQRRNRQNRPLFPEMSKYKNAFERMCDSPVLEAISDHFTGESTLGRPIPNYYRANLSSKTFLQPIDYIPRTYFYPGEPEPCSMQSYTNAKGVSKLIRYLEDLLLANSPDKANIKEQIERLKYAMPVHYMKTFGIKL